MPAGGLIVVDGASECRYDRRTNSIRSFARIFCRESLFEKVFACHQAADTRGQSAGDIRGNRHSLLNVEKYPLVTIEWTADPASDWRVCPAQSLAIENDRTDVKPRPAVAFRGDDSPGVRCNPSIWYAGTPMRVFGHGHAVAAPERLPFLSFKSSTAVSEM